MKQSKMSQESAPLPRTSQDAGTQPRTSLESEPRPTRTSQDDGPQLPVATKKKGEKQGKINLQNILPSIDCWTVLDTPLDFSFMKLSTPAGKHWQTEQTVRPIARSADSKFDFSYLPVPVF